MTSESCRGWLRYWGKARPLDGSAPDHPLVFHSLDVAACARVYMEHNPELSAQLAEWLDLDMDATRQVVCFLVAVHDIGKFAENFQNKVPHVVGIRFDAPLRG